MQVVDSKVVYVPLTQTKTNRKGEDKERTSFARLGVRITLQGGVWWFYHFGAGSWTKHVPGRPTTYKSGSPVLDKGKPVIGPEKKYSYASDKKLTEAFGHCQPLLDALFNGRTDAEIADAEKRAA
jgi:hypothetical protein